MSGHGGHGAAISSHDFYRVVSAIAPLYAAIAAGYMSIRCRFFTTEESAGINRFVMLFAVPLLILRFTAQTDLYEMSWQLFVADTGSKLVVMVGLAVLAVIRGKSAEWCITWFMIATLSNTFIVGIPTLDAMYGAMSAVLIAQIVVLQVLIWTSALLIFYEFRAAQRESLPVAAVDSQLTVSHPPHSAPDGYAGQYSGAVSTSSAPVAPFPLIEGLSAGSKEKVFSTSKDSDTLQPTEYEEATEKFAAEVELHVKDLQDATKEGLSEQESQGGHTREKVVTHKLEEAERELRRQRRTRTWHLLGLKMRKAFSVHAAILGLIYSLVSHKAGFGLPIVVANSLNVLGNTAIGLSMFCLGMFMASTSIFPCSLPTSIAIHLTRFVVAPGLMAAASYATGLRGDTFRVAVVQSALPQAVLTFTLAKEYNVYPEYLSTSVTFGTLISLPVAMAYYVALAHV